MNTSYIQSGTLSSKIFNNYHKTNIEGNEGNEGKNYILSQKYRFK
jgi:hypothetical protein